MMAVQAEEPGKDIIAQGMFTVFLRHQIVEDGFCGKGLIVKVCESLRMRSSLQSATRHTYPPKL
jgi:hypothetical protein